MFGWQDRGLRMSTSVAFEVTGYIQSKELQAFRKWLVVITTQFQVLQALR